MQITPNSGASSVPGAGPQDAGAMERSIRERLDQLKLDLKAEKPLRKVDMKELTTLNQEIETLRTLAGDTRAESLLSSLSDVQNRLIEVHLPELLPQIARHSREPVAFSKVADLYTAVDSRVKNGLAKLDKDFAMVQIRGDGHCCFRSMGYGLAAQLVTPEAAKNKETLQQFEKSLDAMAEKVKAQGGNIQSDVDALKGHLRLLEKGAITINDLVGSNEFVALLRSLVCTHIEKLADKDLRETIAGMSTRADELHLSEDERVASYLTRMKNMNSAEWGDAPEIRTFADIFNVRVGVLHAEDIGRGRVPLADDKVYGPKNSPYQLLLLYRPGHYDAALRR